MTAITPFLIYQCPAHSTCDVSFGLPWKILKRLEVGRPFYGVNYSQLHLTWHHSLRSWSDFGPFWEMPFCICFMETRLSCFSTWRVPGLFFLNHMQLLPCSVCCGMIPLAYIMKIFFLGQHLFCWYQLPFACVFYLLEPVTFIYLNAAACVSYQTQNRTADSAGWKQSGWCILTSLLNVYSERPFWFMWMCSSNSENVVCLHFKPHLMLTKS